MALPSWLIRETERNDVHVHCQIFVGVDADHRQLAGNLVLDPGQFEDLGRLMTDDTRRVELALLAVSDRRLRRKEPAEVEVIFHPGWDHDPDFHVTVKLLGDGDMHLLGRPVPDHAPVDGEIICTLPFKPHVRTMPMGIRMTGGEIANLEWSYFSIETDGTVRWRDKPAGFDES